MGVSVTVSERMSWYVAVRLKDWAKEQGVHYRTAWKWFRDGRLPGPALQTASGTILVMANHFDVSVGL